jgi:hypothetical protein
MKSLNWIYLFLLHLYPASFRDEFGAEMHADFLEALNAASSEGFYYQVCLLLREIADLPHSLLRQYLNIVDRLPADVPPADPWQNIPGTWRAAMLAGLPHILFPLSIYLPAASAMLFGLHPIAWPTQSPFWIMTAFFLLLSWSRGWPRWSSSWIGYGLVFLIDRILWVLGSSPLVYLLASVWSIFTVIVLLRLARRNWLSTLLAVLPLAPMWVWRMGISSSYEILPRAMLFSSIGLMVLLTVIVIVRTGRWQTAMLLMLALVFAVGPTITSAEIDSYKLLSEYNLVSDSPPHASENILLLIVLSTPLWLLAVWRQTNRPRQIN